MDNAVINAEVLSTMGQKARRWFMSWGILFAVFVVRGLLPLIIILLTIPNIGIMGALTATFSNDPQIAKAIQEHSALPLAVGGTFLIFIFLHWLFVEPKNYGLKAERFFHSQAIWFYSLVSILLAFLVWQGLRINTMIAFGVVLGSTVFFITHGFKQFAEAEESTLSSSQKTDWSKILYLEVIDASFSIDGVFGAFAFTFSVLLIFLGNSLGALVLRQLTISNISRIKKYKYLKNGAMYSILVLGSVMLLDVYGADIPSIISPVATFLIVGGFFYKSRLDMNKEVS
ncbi:MAG: DUF475 domain-containing protein [Actinobacteria bacterium]|nr:DUF475 domain-containing protein [Actinomycetota bacterium]